MHPSPESKKMPQPIMDYLFGPTLTLDVAPGPDDKDHPERKQREISYDLCEFDTDPTPIINVDGTPFFTDEEIELIENYNSLNNAIMKAKTDKAKEAKQTSTPSLNLDEILAKLCESNFDLSIL